MHDFEDNGKDNRNLIVHDPLMIAATCADSLPGSHTVSGENRLTSTSGVSQMPGFDPLLLAASSAAEPLNMQDRDGATSGHGYRKKRRCSLLDATPSQKNNHNIASLSQPLRRFGSRNVSFVPFVAPSRLSHTTMSLVAFYLTFLACLFHLSPIAISLSILPIASANPTSTTPTLPPTPPSDLSKVPTPPSFTHEPLNPPVLWFVADNTPVKGRGRLGAHSETLKERTFPCVAHGLPEPKYYWRKDDILFDLSSDPTRIFAFPNEGTFKMKRLRPEDAGVYQCFAFNDNGTAADQPITFKQTYIQAIPMQEPLTASVSFMDPFSRVCEPPPSEPTPYVFWLLKGSGQHFNSLNTSHISNVFLDGKGYIYFAYVGLDDEHSELYYTCAAENKVLKDYKFGNPFSLNVIDKPTEDIRQLPRRAPQKQLVSNDTVAIRGKSFQLHCLFSGYPVPVPTWAMLDGHLDDSRTTYPNFQKTLQIDDVRDTDEGRYQCRFPSLQDLNQEIQVTVEAAPYFVQPPVSKNSSEGESEHFICGAVGKPAPYCEFYKNGQPLKADGEKITIHGNFLKIENLKKGSGIAGDGDNGVYQCKATNKHGSVWANFYLNLLSYAPVIQEGPGTVEAIAGDGVDIFCRVFGSPAASVEWYHDNQLLTNGDLYEAKRVQQDPGLYRLNIFKVEHNMAGSYKCIARNKYGEAEKDGNLVVLHATKIIEGPLKNIEKEGSRDRTVIAGTRIDLHCRVTHDPLLKANITWTWNGRPVSLEDKGFKLLHDDANTLVLLNSAAQYSGNYSCHAKTKLDTRSESIKVVVKDVPAAPFNVYIDCVLDGRGALVTWSHLESGSSHAPVQSFIIQWNPGFHKLDWHTHHPVVPYRHWKFNGEYYEDKATVLVSPWGNYTFRVIARNEIGDSPPSRPTQNCTVPAARPEKNPTGVIVKGTTPSNLVISWEPMKKVDWNGPDLKYVVRHRPVGTDEWTEEIVPDPTASLLVIDGVDTFEKYEAQVQARNHQGFSNEQPKIYKGYSGEGKPTEYPANFIKKRAMNPQAARFSWDPVAASSIHGEFKGYKISHWAYEKRSKRSADYEGLVPKATKVAYFAPDSHEGTIYDLTPNIVNFARICVFSGAGDGVSSPIINFTMPPGKPEQVSMLTASPISPEKMAIMWSKPRRTNGPLKGYLLSYQKVEQENADGELVYSLGSHSEQYIADPLRISSLVEELDPETKYEFTVIAETQAGPGEPRSVLQETMPLDVPDGYPLAPTFAVASIGEDHVNATWIPGQYHRVINNKPVGENFFFEYREKDSENWIKSHPVGKDFTVTIDGLDSGTLYELRAVTVHGTDEDGNPRTSASEVLELETQGPTEKEGSFGWLIAIVIAILILLIILIVVCLVVRNRGAKYPVSKKEYAQGREPFLKAEKDFQEFHRPHPDEEKQSLTGAGSFKAESETDSMLEYGNGDLGKFTEDGSFIGQYVPHSTPPRSNKAFVGNGGDHSATERQAAV